MTATAPGIINQNAELVDVATLQRHPANPRKGDLAAVVESIETNGFFGFIVAQVSTRHVIAGNHRLMAAKQLGIDEVPTVWVDVDDEQAMRILLADNRTSDLATYDNDQLEALLTELAGSDLGLIGTGYDDEDLDRLLGDFSLPEPGDAAVEGFITEYRIVVTCEGEGAQFALLERLMGEGFECEALIS